MLTIFLPGYSLKNKEEQDDISSALENAGYKVYRHQWQHWTNESIPWNPQTEVTKVLEFIKNSGDKEFSLIGKSFGTFISVEILKSMPAELSIKLLILMGIPVKNLDKTEVSEYNILDNTQVPLYLIQNNNDPYGDIDEVREILEDSNYKELIMEAETHEYKYIEEILEIFKENFTTVNPQ